MPRKPPLLLVLNIQYGMRGLKYRSTLTKSALTCTTEDATKGDIFTEDDGCGVLGEGNIQGVSYRLQEGHLGRLSCIN